MKKFIIGIIICLIAVLSIFMFNKNKKEDNTNLKKVKVAEVAHTIFYAPQYAALSKGYFKEEGLDIDLILTPGADKVTSAVLSGDVNIGFCGSEASIYVYNSGEKDYIVSFAGLTKRDGAFLVSRNKIDTFSLDDLQGNYVLGGRKCGLPEMTFEYTLKENGISLDDLTIDTSIDFASMGGTFIGGLGDFVTLFEPSATQIENQGLGHVVAYIGEYGGAVPYTAYNAKKSYIKKNKDVIEKFTKAVNKGLDYVWNNDEKTIAKTIVEYFPDMTINELATMIKRYKDNDAWMKDTYFTEESFDHLQDIMIEAGQLEKKVPYDDLVNTTFSNKK